MNELIKEQIKKNAITKEDLYNYKTFIVHALLGLSPTGADLFYKKHENAIDKVAKCYRECWSYPKDNLYRGIILEDKYIRNENMLDPQPKVAYLSFSESKVSAEVFADTESDMSMVLMSQTPDAQGYLMEYQPPAEEILFCWEWARELGLEQLPIMDMDLIKEQREVLVKQTGRRFRLQPFKKD